MKDLCTILGYHEVAPLQPGMRRSLVVSPRMFHAHLLYLRLSGCVCVSLKDVGRAFNGEVTLPKRAFAITFDDGYVGIHRYATSLLAQFGYTATVFVPSQMMGQEAEPGDTAPVAKMNAEELRDILAAGLTIGSHTRTHADLTVLPPDELRAEIVDSRRELEHVLRCAVNTFSYPFGHVDAPSTEAVKDAGYGLACTTEFGRVQPNACRYRLPRVLIGENLSLQAFIWRFWRAGATSPQTVCR